MKQTGYGVRRIANAGFRLILLLVMMLIAGGVAVSAQVATIYVSSGATGANDGSSWANAYTDLQDALASATAGDEIWVAAGVYKPGTDRKDSFAMKNGVALYGGFPATGNPGMADRNWEIHKTILSGDIDNDDINTDGNSVAETDADIQGNNSYHVVKSSGTDSTAILDGFIITAGQASESGPHGHSQVIGGGMYNNNSSPTVKNCTFSGNSAQHGGGGMHNENSSPTVSNCTFSKNSASMFGGGMYNGNSNPTVTDCNFSGNSGAGGGMYNDNSNSLVSNCTFSRNFGDLWGGGIYNDNSSPAVTGCTFSCNSAIVDGGGIYNRDGSSPTVSNCNFSGNSTEHGGGGGLSDFHSSSSTVSNCIFSGNSALYGGGMTNNSSNPTVSNCIFSGNSALYGGGMYNRFSSLTASNCTFSGNSAEDGGGMYNDRSSSAVNNCIFWNNSSEIESGGTGTVTVSYSIVKGGVAGTGNIDEDPLFITPVDPSAAPTTAGDLHLQAGSPAIDAGNNSALPTDTGDADGDGNTTETIDVDADGNPRITDGVTDMGAYEVLFKTVITGLPSGTTGSTSASATVGGDGIVAYKYRLDNGAWSAEIPVGTPVSLSGLSNGIHTLHVIGKRSGGMWQPASYPTTATWTVLILPVVTTSPVSNVSATSATCGGHVSYDGSGSLLSRGVCWDTEPEPNTGADPHIGNGTDLGDFISQISNLQPETAYYVRAYASVKTDGLTYTVYGEQFTFTTPKETLPGDVNGDETVGLTDAVLALQILAGIDTGDTEINPDADVDDDGRIGIPEVIYILRILSEQTGMNTETSYQR